MKVGFIFGEFCIGNRPLDFNTLFTSGRGLTGSDIGVSRVAQEFAKQGHDVSLFTIHAPNKPSVWEGVKLHDLNEVELVIRPDWDAVISWSEPDQFRRVPTSPVRLCSQQLNGFTYCKPGFDDGVDIWASPSEAHRKYHAHQTPSPDKWVVVHDGCDPEIYTTGQKVPGRVVHISSPDRGLHWLLQEWQNIKAQVPEANLRVFYHSSHGSAEDSERGIGKAQAPEVQEIGQRVRYLNRAIEALKPLGVERVGSVSRNDMVQELNAAMVLGYPASIVNDFCEGFGCAVMEACAAGCIPVISDVDAFGTIYGGAAPMIHSPVQPHMKQFTDLVVRSLKDKQWIEETTRKCKNLAAQNTWKLAADKYIKLIQEHPKYRGIKPAVKPTIIEEPKMTVAPITVSHDAEPTISIVMPTNRVGGLDLVFRGLENQTFKNFELILVDSLYKHRKDLVAEKAKQYSFKVKHVEPTKNTFPEAHFCNAENTGLVNVSAKLILMITDYTYLPPDCVERHVNFHIACPAENVGYMCPHQYKSLPAINPAFPTYKNEETDRYIGDIKSGNLNSVMWSLFKEDFNQDPEALPLDSMGNADNKLFLPFGTGDQHAFNGKNESMKTEAALKINGWDEDLDGTTPYQDNLFADMLVHKMGFTWLVDKDNKVYIINPRSAFPWSKRLRPIDSNRIIWERKRAEEYRNPTNGRSIREERDRTI